MFHGAGKLIYANGDVYSGEFEDGSKHGSGQLTLAIKKEEKKEKDETAVVDKIMKAGATIEESAGIYIGEFYKDEMHGNGTFTFADGSEYIGRF